MTLSITNNGLSQRIQQQLSAHNDETSRLLSRLSSGLRIGGAADDPAGQAITSRMSSKLQGMSQAMRNINDASSMLQVADSAMANVGDSLQRLRELAVQSNDATLSDDDRGALQQEANQILSQITQVGTSTSFNGQAVFAQDDTSIGGDEQKRAVIDGLKTGWLSSAEDMVKKYYGLSADGSTITVNLNTTDGPYNVLASVSGSTQSDGKVTDLSLNLDMADFGDAAATPSGGTNSSLYNDRTVAHEMVHAIMDRSVNMGGLPIWFKEGTAELIQGADERLAGAVAGSGAAAVVSAVSNSMTASSSFLYEGGYAASRYLHEKLKELGVNGGIKGLMTYMSQNASATLDTALNAVTGGQIADSSAFLNDFHANGAAYISTQMNLTNADTGAIGGLDADGGVARDAQDVVLDQPTNPSDKPLQNFSVVFPDLGGATGVKRVQVQAGAGTSKNDLIDLQFSAMNAHSLGLASLNLDNGAVALLHIDQAIDFVDKQRASNGASSNRLDAAAANLQTSSANLQASQSRIQDTDYASDTVKLTRSQILQQAASAILTQANGEPNMVLALLR